VAVLIYNNALLFLQKDAKRRKFAARAGQLGPVDISYACSLYMQEGFDASVSLAFRASVSFRLACLYVI